MKTDYEKTLERAEAIVRDAGEILREYHDKPDQVEWKGADDPVTAADKAVNRFLVAAIGEAFPDDAILSEESRDDLVRLKYAKVWCIDPLDGTKEFMARNGEFSIMVGLAVEGRAMLGVVYQPIVDILYSGIRDEGSRVFSGGKSRTLLVSQKNEPVDLRLVVSRSHRNPITDRIKTALGIAHERISGSVGIKCGLIAEGEADLYLHPAPGTKEWDTCAPEAILTGAGGRMTDCWGRPLVYNASDVRRRFGLVASNGLCHSMVVERMVPALAEEGISPDAGW
ncbi:MAG: 3'(2'),5'-bisphosphate nucleotidase CysQ [Desulfobacterales bacterium]|nr:3'(2'),5'-bisphosphate nucleotidase CysQ [Desulfobacterales bacterium]